MRDGQHRRERPADQHVRGTTQTLHVIGHWLNCTTILLLHDAPLESALAQDPTARVNSSGPSKSSWSRCTPHAKCLSCNHAGIFTSQTLTPMLSVISCGVDTRCSATFSAEDDEFLVGDTQTLGRGPSHGGLHESRRHCVDVNTESARLQRQCSHHSLNAGFSSGIVRLPSATASGVRREEDEFANTSAKP